MQRKQHNLLLVTDKLLHNLAMEISYKQVMLHILTLVALDGYFIGKCKSKYHESNSFQPINKKDYGCHV
jgi:hypothetical protein